jgi:hypothetical protein
MHGIFRTYDETWREQAHSLIRHMLPLRPKLLVAAVRVHMLLAIPALLTIPTLLKGHGCGPEEHTFGRHQAVEDPAAYDSRDFAYFSRQRPSCFYRLGTHHEGKGPYRQPAYTSFRYRRRDITCRGRVDGLDTLCAMEALDQVGTRFSPS